MKQEQEGSNFEKRDPGLQRASTPCCPFSGPRRPFSHRQYSHTGASGRYLVGRHALTLQLWIDRLYSHVNPPCKTWDLGSPPCCRPPRSAPQLVERPRFVLTAKVSVEDRSHSALSETGSNGTPPLSSGNGNWMGRPLDRLCRSKRNNLDYST